MGLWYLQWRQNWHMNLYQPSYNKRKRLWSNKIDHKSQLCYSTSFKYGTAQAPLPTAEFEFGACFWKYWKFLRRPNSNESGVAFRLLATTNNSEEWSDNTPKPSNKLFHSLIGLAHYCTVNKANETLSKRNFKNTHLNFKPLIWSGVLFPKVRTQ